jgi:hypothetical protein
MAMRARKQGESRGSYAKYVKEYKAGQAAGAKGISKKTVKRAKTGASGGKKKITPQSIARASAVAMTAGGTPGVAAGGQGLALLQAAMAKRKKKR